MGRHRARQPEFGVGLLAPEGFPNAGTWRVAHESANNITIGNHANNNANEVIVGLLNL